MDGIITLGVILQDQTLSLVNLLMLLGFLFLNQSACLQSLSSHFFDCDLQTSNSQNDIFWFQKHLRKMLSWSGIRWKTFVLPKTCPSVNSKLLSQQVLTGIRKCSLATRTICTVKHIFSLKSPRNCEENWTIKQIQKTPHLAVRCN